MKKNKFLAVGGAVVVLAAALASVALAAGRGQARSGVPVTVRVEGVRRTLLVPTRVNVPSGWVTRFGAPRGECSEDSAQGALDVATHHRWRGTWSTEFGPEYEITSILGEAHPFAKNKPFWEIFVGNVAASAGGCELHLHAGEQLLFAAVPSVGPASRPLVIQDYPRHATAGSAFGLRVFAYTDKRRTVRVAGAEVSGNGVHATTNHFGVARITPTKSGTLVLQATKGGFIRSAPVTVHVS